MCFFLSARKLLVFVNQNFSEHIINKHERIVLHLCLHSVSSSTYRPVCILSFLSTAETDVLVQALSQSTDGVVVSFVVVLKFPNVTIRTTKTVESVQLNGVVVSVAVVLKFPNMTIRTTKTVESIHLKGRIKIFGCFPPFYLPLHLCYYLPKHIVLLFDSWKPFGHLQLLLS